ncbi:DNA-binding protein HU [Pullulanibacillus camelliae]|uniref:DNA-binding protein HU n=2 Tax=Pullulanibacillus camelliae TaxID=1707096 RepID=A0A8J2YMB1_9BACL|nr:DNA-binding protein HU [Pullulanibacillus camelliae]
MNKQQIVDNISVKTGLSKSDVDKVINGVIEEVTEALREKDRVQFVGFGTFETRERSSRKGRNPQTGEEIDIPASTVPAFRAGNKLKEAVK